MGQPGNAERQFRDLGKEIYPFKLLGDDPHDQPTMPSPDRILAAVGVELTLDPERFLTGQAHLYKLVTDPEVAPAAAKAVVASHNTAVNTAAEDPQPSAVKKFLGLAVPPTVSTRMGNESSHLIGGLVVFEDQDGLETALFNSSRFLAELKGEAHKFVAAARNGRYPHGIGRSEVEAINRDHLKVSEPRILHANILGGIEKLIVASLPDEVSLRRVLHELSEPESSTELRREAS